MDENKIKIINDDGKEEEFNILLTFDANDKNYVVVYDDINDEEYYVFTYDDKGGLYPVEDEKELALVQEVVDAFDEEHTNEDN